MGQVRHRIRPFLPQIGKVTSGFSPRGRPLPAEISALPSGPVVQSPGRLREGVFTFLNRTRRLGWPPEWVPEGLPRLWLYNLHYFQWLESLNYPDCRLAVRDWIGRCPPSDRKVGWEPYPVSVRLINWSRIFYGRDFPRLKADPSFREELEESFVFQARWLNRRLETRLYGNHLLENAVALAVAGNVLGGKEASGWRRRGARILQREIGEQVLPDGVHFELSPMYHLRAVWLLLLLAAGGGGEALRPPAGLVERMLGALDLLSHPDGEIALFNDSAFDIYPGPAALRQAAERIGLRLEPMGEKCGGWELPASGYYGFRDRDGNSLICDAGPIGPDYIPGHGHGDIFSFELSLKGRRVVVDSGVSGYEPGPERDYDRSTRAHNTVEIGGVDQAEFWGAFRVARRGRPRQVECRVGREEFSLQGWHDGYRRLAGSPVHRRSLSRHPGGIIAVQDWVHGSCPVRAISRVHLHPDCRLETLSRLAAVIAYPGGTFLIEFSGSGDLEVEKSFYSPCFGDRRGNIALAFSARGDNMKFGFRIIPAE